MGGGPSGTQKAGAAQNLQNAQQEGALASSAAQQFNKYGQAAGGFYGNEMQNGLPFFGSLQDFNTGTTAQAFNPAKANFLRSASSRGALPSGFKAAGMNDIQQGQAQTFDQNTVNNLMLQQQAKQQGAAGTAGIAQMFNPAAFYGGSTSAGQSVMQPLQPAYNPWMGVLGGGVQGAASSIPF
jgi:hypothetical protein